AWVGTKAKSLVIQGSLDPWFSLNDVQAKKMGRTSLPRIEYNSLSALKESNSGSIRNSTIYYSNLYSQDVANMKSFFSKHGVNATFKHVSAQEASDLSSQQILTSDSPELQEILAFTLTWSDNLLAERIARLASFAAGHSLDDVGVAQTFDEVLRNLGIESRNLVTQDASGLSKQNRITARQVGSLLIKIRENSQFAPLIGGLPIGGISGTLRNRFIETAPQAIGLIKAKTGTLNGTANLAGYVESGDREYAFVILADRLSKTSRAENRARDTVDRILGKIAYPVLPGVIEQPQDEMGIAATSNN
ncbi:MAG: D-alanyl-D-alanine carboxypeptidase, partial [Actinomycetales bacterium]|nr:D-alanyl-D-alanine carboxypeptidase [Actinomycetales bacterium]